MEYTLTMVFNTEYGVKTSLSVSGVKSTITKAEADALMDTIIAKDVFTTNSGKLVGKESASLIGKQTTKFEVK
jgi:hypothetical protein